MNTVPFNIVGGSYENRSRGQSVQRSINLYPENNENVQSKTPTQLVYTPGSSAVTTIGGTTVVGCRGFWYSSTGPDLTSLLYTVYDNKFYRVNSNYTTVEIGTIASGTGPVSISDNGFDLVIADGVNLYKADLLADDFTLRSTFQVVTLPPLPGPVSDSIRPSTVEFINQRFVINAQNNVFLFSQLASTTFTDDFGVANFYSAESNADAIRAIKNVNGRLWIFGDRSFEVWSAEGDDNDPFSFVGGSQSNIGVQSKFSVAVMNELIFWLGSSDAGRNTVFMASGLNAPTRISTNALENTLGTLTGTEGGVGWAYTNEGHIFYVLTFKQAARTFVYDVSTQLWHERGTRDWATATFKAWEPTFAVVAYNKIFHGSVESNRLLLLDPNKYTDADGLPVVRERITTILSELNNPFNLREVNIDMEVGTTPLLAALGRDPQCIMSVSVDGGYTYTDLEWRSIGTQGNYLDTVTWNNLGYGRAITCKFTFSDPSPIVIYGGRATIEGSTRR